MANIKRIREIPETGTVTVACNVNTGIVLQLYEMEESEEAVLGGGMRVRKVAAAIGDPVKLFGPALAKGATPKCLIVGGYALTPNVDAQFMKRWMEDNKATLIVKNECVLVYAAENDARAAAKDHRDFRSGLEPIIPGVDAKGMPNDKRIPKKTATSVGKLSAIDSELASV